ncbi:MAG: phage major capsid protein [Gammaproteobacteria bacterium]
MKDPQIDIALIEYGLFLRGKTPKEGTDKYGNVEFADEKNKKYPIDTEEHIRAAWNYIHKKKNAAEYDEATLAEVKAKIVAAWKAKIDEKGPPAAQKRKAGTLHLPNTDAAPQSTRNFVIEMDQREVRDDRRVNIAFSSETPVRGYSGMEVLDHGRGADFSRLNNGAPLLLNHDPRQQIGVVESANIGADRKGRAVIRFSKNPDADAIYQDVKDGIRRNISVGYDHGDPVAETTREGKQIQRIHNWQPMELSIVSMPADATVGVNRELNAETFIHTENSVTGANALPTTEQRENATMTEVELKAQRDAEVKSAADGAMKAERERASAINGMLPSLKKMGLRDADDMAKRAIESGQSKEDFTATAFAEMAKNVDTGVQRASASDAIVGLTAKEAQSFSFRRMILAQVEPTAKNKEAAKFEIETCEAARSLSPTGKGTFTIPFDVLRAKATRSALSASSSDVVATNLLAGDFIEYLYNLVTVAQAGAIRLDGLVGNVNIPRRSGTATGYWLSTDTSALTESETAFDNVALTPHTLTGFSKYSRQLLAQATPAVEQLVRDDLAQVIAVGLDAAAINGSGSSGQPTGILQTSGVGEITLGTNGAAPTYVNVVDMVGLLMKANAYKGKLAWLINGQVFETFATTARIGSTYPTFIMNDPYTQLLGHPVFNSQNVPSTLTKGSSSGVCSATIFGNFADLIIAGWAGLDILVDPYTYASSNEVGVYAYQMNDIGLRHVGSFAMINDMLTT